MRGRIKWIVTRRYITHLTVTNTVEIPRDPSSPTFREHRWVQRAWRYQMSHSHTMSGDHLHLSNGCLGTRIGAEGREGGISALVVNVSMCHNRALVNALTACSTSWLVFPAGKCGALGRAAGKDVRAVGESSGVMSELAHGLKDELEPVLEFVLVG